MRRAGRRSRPERHGGGASIAILTVLLMLALAAGVSPYASRMLAQAPTSPSGLVPAPHRQATADAPDDTWDPAVTRAAEAGLHGMRVQFAQTLQAGHAGAEAALEARRPAGANRGAPEAPPTRRQLRLPIHDRFVGAGVPTEGSVTWIGEATVLIRSHGMTVLTDPNFLRRGEPAHILPGLPDLRRADPALDFDELPPIDLVVLSRLREDHFDRLARRLLPRDVPIVAPAAARAELVSMGFAAVHALPEWGELRIDRGDAWLQLTATPTRTGPRGIAAMLPASMGTLMAFGRADAPAAYRLWISGDTGIDDTLLGALAPRLVDLDLALLHVGGTTVLGVGGSMDAPSSLRAIERLAPRTAIALRLGDFRGEADRAPAAAPAAREASVGRSRIRTLERGESHRFVPLQHWALAEDDPATARR